MTQVILVDEKNNELGTMEKLEAHRKGILHRAFSIFIFNNAGQLLLQQRNKHKYHSGGLWSNSVCSHPSPGEDYETAAHRRLQEELGFDCSLSQKTCFIYKNKFDNGLTEHEHDCIFSGIYDGQIAPNPREVEDYKWIDLAELRADIKKHPSNYTYWFKIIIHDGIF